MIIFLTKGILSQTLLIDKLRTWANCATSSLMTENRNNFVDLLESITYLVVHDNDVRLPDFNKIINTKGFRFQMEFSEMERLNLRKIINHEEISHTMAFKWGAISVESEQVPV